MLNSFFLRKVDKSGNNQKPVKQPKDACFSLRGVAEHDWTPNTEAKCPAASENETKTTAATATPAATTTTTTTTTNSINAASHVYVPAAISSRTAVSKSNVAATTTATGQPAT